MVSRGSLVLVFAALAFGGLASTAVRARDGAILAVFDMEDRGAGLAPETLTNLTDYLAVLMAEGGYQVVPRDQIKARLKAQAAESMKDCYDQSCQVELGRELAAQKTLATQIFKIGSMCRVTGTMFDLRKAATDKAASTKSKCTEEDLGEALEKIAKKLTGKRVDVAKAKEEAARRAKEEADREAKQEAARKAKEEADRKAREEAARKAKEEAARKAEEEAARKAEEEAARRAKEQAGEQAGEAGEHDQTPFDVAETWWHVGFGLGLVFPTFTEADAAYLDYRDGDALYLDSFLGGWLRIYSDFKVSRYFSLGLSIGHLSSQAESVQQNESNNLNVSFVMFVPKLRWPVTDVVDLRLSVGLGAALMHSSGQYSTREGKQADLDQLGKNLGMEISLGAAWYLTEGFGLVFELGILAGIVGELEDQSSMGVDEYGLGGPIMFLAVCAEFGG